MKVCTWRVEVFTVNMTRAVKICRLLSKPTHRWWLYASLLAEWPKPFRFDPQFVPKLQHLDCMKGPEWWVYSICRHKKCVTGDLCCSKKIMTLKLSILLDSVVSLWKKSWDLFSFERPTLMECHLMSSVHSEITIWQSVLQKIITEGVILKWSSNFLEMALMVVINLLTCSSQKSALLPRSCLELCVLTVETYCITEQITLGPFFCSLSSVLHL